MSLDGDKKAWSGNGTYLPVKIHCSLAAQLQTGETPSQEIQSCLFSHMYSSVRECGVRCTIVFLVVAVVVGGYAVCVIELYRIVEYRDIVYKSSLMV